MLNCGFDRPPSRDAVDRFFTDLKHVIEAVFDRLIEQPAARGLLDLTYRIDSTDVRAVPADPDASKCYGPTAEEYYYGYGCTIASTKAKIPITAEFTFELVCSWIRDHLSATLGWQYTWETNGISLPPGYGSATA